MKFYFYLYVLRIVAGAVFDTADIYPKNDINAQVGKTVEIAVSLKPEQISNGCTIDKVKIYVKGENLTELVTIYNDTSLVMKIDSAKTTDSGFYMIVCDDQGIKKAFLGARYINIIYPPSPVYDFQCFSANWVEMECTWKVHNYDDDHNLYYSVFDYPSLEEKNKCPSQRNGHRFHASESLPEFERRPFLQGMAKGYGPSLSNPSGSTDQHRLSGLSFEPANKCRFVNKPSAILPLSSKKGDHGNYGDVLVTNHHEGGHLEFFPDWTYYFIMVSENAIGTIVQNFSARPKDIVKPDPPKIHVTAGTDSVTIRLLSSVSVSPDGMPLQFCLNVTCPHLDRTNFSLGYSFDFVTGTVRSELTGPDRATETRTGAAYPLELGVDGTSTVVVRGLLPYLAYAMEIRAKPLHNGYISEPNAFVVQTLEKAPEIVPETSVSGFELSRTYTEDNNKVTIYWKSIPRAYQFGPDFHYNLYDWDNLVAINLTNNFYSLQLERFDTAKHMFRITAANSMGEGQPSLPVPFCQKKFLVNPQNVRIIHFSKSSYTLAWNNAKRINDVKAYTIYWCKTHKYIPFTCGPDIEWITLGSNDARISRHGPSPAKADLAALDAGAGAIKPDRDVLTFNLTLDTNFLAGVAYETFNLTLTSQGIVWGLCVLKYPQKPKAPKLSTQSSWSSPSSRTLKIEWTKEACQSEGGPVAFYELYYALLLTHPPNPSNSPNSSLSIEKRGLGQSPRSQIQSQNFAELNGLVSSYRDNDSIRSVLNLAGKLRRFGRKVIENGAPDTAYRNSGPIRSITGIPYGNSTYAILTDLTPDTSYVVWMRSVSLAGIYSQPSTRIAAKTLEDVPEDACGNLTLSYRNDSLLRFTWSAPTRPNGLILYTELNFTEADAGVADRFRRFSGDLARSHMTSRSYRVGGSANTFDFRYGEWDGDITYVLKVRACNSVGCSPAPDGFTFTTPVTEPSVMGTPEHTLLNRTHVMIGWKPPQHPNGPIVYFDLQVYKENNDSHLDPYASYVILITPDQKSPTSANVSIDCSPLPGTELTADFDLSPADFNVDGTRLASTSGPKFPKYYVSIRAVNRDPSSGYKRASPYTRPKLISNVCYQILSIVTGSGQGVGSHGIQRRTFLITGALLCTALVVTLFYFTGGIKRNKLTVWIRNMELKVTLPWDEEEFQRYNYYHNSGHEPGQLPDSAYDGSPTAKNGRGRAKRGNQLERLDRISNIDLYLIKDGQPNSALDLGDDTPTPVTNCHSSGPTNKATPTINFTPISLGSFSFDSEEADDSSHKSINGSLYSFPLKNSSGDATATPRKDMDPIYLARYTTGGDDGRTLPPQNVQTSSTNRNAPMTYTTSASDVPHIFASNTESLVESDPSVHAVLHKNPLSNLSSPYQVHHTNDPNMDSIPPPPSSHRALAPFPVSRTSTADTSIIPALSPSDPYDSYPDPCHRVGAISYLSDYGSMVPTSPPGSLTYAPLPDVDSKKGCCASKGFASMDETPSPGPSYQSDNAYFGMYEKDLGKDEVQKHNCPEVFVKSSRTDSMACNDSTGYVDL